MDLNKLILTPDGQEMTMSYPSKMVLDQLPKLENGIPDISVLPKETIRNVIIQCLIRSRPKDFKEGTMVQILGQEVVKAEKELMLKPELMDFLIEIIKSQIYIEDKTQDGIPYSMGVYRGWILTQVVQELGVKIE